MTISRSRVAAVTASLVFALSGGVAIADEAAATAQPAAEAAAQEQATTETQATGAEGATASAATGGSTVGQAQDSGEASNQAGEKDEADGAKADEAAAKDAQKADESKSGETTDAQKAGEAKTDGTADAKDAAGSGEATTATDDTILEPQVAEYTERIYHRDTRTEETRTVSESDIEWVPVDVSKYSSDEFRYVDEDGFRIYYHITDSYRLDGSEEAVKNEYISARLKIGENGEFLARAEGTDPHGISYRLSTDHTSGNLQPVNRSGVLGYGYAASFMDADVPKDVFTKTLVDKYGETFYYYPGGEYGPAGYYYRVAEDSHMTKAQNSRYVGMYWHFDTEGGSPFSGTSANSEGQAAPAVMAATTSYESGTATATPATGSAYVSPTASAAAETTPATSDATSLAGAIAAAISALGALGLGKAVRRK